MGRPLRSLFALAILQHFTSAYAGIFQWEYINPHDPSLGKQQSTTLCPDGAGVDTVPGADLSFRNLTMAYLIGADLTGANGGSTNLTNADLTLANLANAYFGASTLTDAHFTNAEVRGANFYRSYYSAEGISLAQLYSTASYQAHDLTGIHLGNHDLGGGNFTGQNLTDADFSGAGLMGADFRESKLTNADFTRTYLTGINFAGLNLTNARFEGAMLTGADFTGAEVLGAQFGKVLNFINGGMDGTGLTLAQLYSTASYQAHDLKGIGLNFNDLAGGDFAGQSLTNANFGWARLVDVDLTAADARGAHFTDFSGATTTNLIRPDGHIIGLDLDAGGLLVVHDYDGPVYDPSLLVAITVDQQLAMDPGSALRMVFEADAWDSTISFTPGIPVTLGGTLDLTFADDVNLASQVGRTFDLFDWAGVMPTGEFTVASPYRWDLSHLYITGEVMLTAVPEPSTLLLMSIALMARKRGR